MLSSWRGLTACAIGVVCLGAAACASTTADAAATGTSAIDSTDAISDLLCNAPGFAFEVTPSGRGPGYDGNLTIEAGTSQFQCSGDALVTCTEWPQGIHPGTWSIAVTRDGHGTLTQGDGSSVSLSCAERSATVDAGPMPTYAEEAPVIEEHCSGCHGSDFSTLTAVRAKRGGMYSKIVAGEMPYGDADFKNSLVGLRLLDFLEASPELN